MVIANWANNDGVCSDYTDDGFPMDLPEFLQFEEKLQDEANRDKFVSTF